MSVLVGVSGKIGSGKNYLSEKLTTELERLGYTVSESSFATPLKNDITEIIQYVRKFTDEGVDYFDLFPLVSHQFNIPLAQVNELLYTMYPELIADRNLTGWSRSVGVRKSLQFFGTEIRRAQDPDYWVKKFIAYAAEQEIDFLFVTDARFANEMDAVVDTKGVAIRINLSDEVLKIRREGRDGVTYTDEQLNHISETSLDDYPRFHIVVGETFSTREMAQTVIRKAGLKKTRDDKLGAILEAKLLEHTPTHGEKKDTYPINPPNKGQFTVNSLFSGAGGLDLGFELAGLDALLGKETVSDAFATKDAFDTVRETSLFKTQYVNDNFKDANATYRLNFPDTFIDSRDIKKVVSFPEADVVVGGFPCPGFSAAGPRLLDDPRNFLYLHFIRCVKDANPKFFVAENVKGLLTHANGLAFKQIVEDFAAMGYNVYHKLLLASDYGVPQNRERVILVGVRKDIDFVYEFPAVTHGEGLLPKRTLHDAIGDLVDTDEPYHTGGFSSRYLSRRHKLTWSESSKTVIATGRHAPLHPGGEPQVKVDGVWSVSENDRRITPREMARLQTFPDWFEFVSLSVGTQNTILDKQYRQIGNAVPVELARVIAQPIAIFLANS